MELTATAIFWYSVSEKLKRTGYFEDELLGRMVYDAQKDHASQERIAVTFAESEILRVFQLFAQEEGKK